MSGFDAVLATASLAFQIFSGCIDGFELLSDLQNAEDSSSSLQCMLQLEEHRLLAWARRSGLSNDKLDKRLDSGVVRQTLTHIRVLLSDTNSLKPKYSMFPVSASAVSVSPMASLTKLERRRILGSQYVPGEESSMKKRVCWIVKDKRAFERLLGHLRCYTDNLHELLDGVQQDAMHDDIRFLHLQIISIADKLEDIRSIKLAMESIKGPGPDACSCAAVKETRMGLEGTNIGILNSGVHAAKPLSPLRHRLLTDIVGDANRGMAKYDMSPVFIEWKSIYPEDTGARALEIDNRVANLATLLSTQKSASFRSLTCVGYFEDTQSLRYCLLYHPPELASRDRRPRSLLDLFYDQSLKPSLSARIRLASGIATTLLHIHASGWLHKGVRSDNILFFPS
jgi:hypothetical protein